MVLCKHVSQKYMFLVQYKAIIAKFYLPKDCEGSSSIHRIFVKCGERSIGNPTRFNIYPARFLQAKALQEDICFVYWLRTAMSVSVFVSYLYIYNQLYTIKLLYILYTINFLYIYYICY